MRRATEGVAVDALVPVEAMGEVEVAIFAEKARTASIWREEKAVDLEKR